MDLEVRGRIYGGFIDGHKSILDSKLEGKSCLKLDSGCTNHKPFVGLVSCAKGTHVYCCSKPCVGIIVSSVNRW